MCKWWDRHTPKKKGRRLWFGGILHQVKLDSVNKVGSKWNAVTGKVQECAWKEALWLNIFKGKMCFLCVKCYIFTGIYATGLDGQFSFVASIHFFWLHLTPTFLNWWVSDIHLPWLDEENSAPPQKKTGSMNLTAREMEMLDSNHRVVSPYDLLFSPAPPGQRSPLVLSSSFFTQLEAPAATLWLVRCSPVAHLAMGRQRVEGETRARGERGTGNGDDQIIG